MGLKQKVERLEIARAEILKARQLEHERRRVASEGDMRRALARYSDAELDQIIFESCGIAQASVTCSDEELQLIVEGSDEELRRLANR
jgi:hypothetical protein